jgi:hypothetical protein
VPKEVDVVNAKKIETMKRNWNPLWHIVSNDKRLHTTKRHELFWLHSFEEIDIIIGNIL